MSLDVTIVGGYGHVGSLVARALRRLHPTSTIRIAGRNASRAAEVAAALDASALHVDLMDPTTWPGPTQGPSVMLVCVDHVDASFARHAIDSGYDYVDITASPELTQRLAGLDEYARSARLRVLLSVGLAPGLTNLLAKGCAQALDEVDEVAIAVRIGLADHYGPAAAEWTASHVSSGPLVPVAFREERHSLGLPARFSDQYVIPRTLGVPHAQTTLTMESGRWTRVLSWLWSLIRRWPRASTSLSGLLERLGLASDRYGLAVRASGWLGGAPCQATAFLEGHRESQITALMAAAACTLISRVEQPGVHHLEQVSDIDDFSGPLKQAGCQLHFDQPEPSR